jgi:ribosome recycling factor
MSLESIDIKLRRFRHMMSEYKKTIEEAEGNLKKHRITQEEYDKIEAKYQKKVDKMVGKINKLNDKKKKLTE